MKMNHKTIKSAAFCLHSNKDLDLSSWVVMEATSIRDSIQEDYTPMREKVGLVRLLFCRAGINSNGLNGLPSHCNHSVIQVCVLIIFELFCLCLTGAKHQLQTDYLSRSPPMFDERREYFAEYAE